MKSIIRNVFGVALPFCCLLIQTGHSQSGFTDGFEADAIGSFPSSWFQSGNSAITVDNSTSHSGSNSLRMFGVVGGCWASVVHHQLSVAPPWQLTCYVKNGAERGTGCHPELGGIAVSTGPSWTYPALFLALFRAASGETNQLQIQSPATGSLVTVGTFNTNQWYKVTVRYQIVGSNALSLSTWINDSLLAVNIYTNLASNPTNFTYLTLASEEGTTWFDDISAAPAPSFSVAVSPVSQSIGVGNSATFCAVTTNQDSLTYQWQKNGTNIIGATNACLSLGNVGSAAGLKIVGPIAANYTIQCIPSLNQTNWTTLTNISLPTQPYIFIDYNSPTNSNQFYRAVQQ